MSDEQESANVPDSEYEERKDFIDYIQDIVKKISKNIHLTNELFHTIIYIQFCYMSISIRRRTKN